MTPVEIPASAARLVAKAEAQGWRVLTETHVGEHKGRAMESVVVRLRRRDERLVAMWENGKFYGAWQRVPLSLPEGGVSPRRISSRDLQAVVVA